MPAVELPEALAEVRALLLDVDRLTRAVGAGRRRGQQPRWRRVELHPVDLKAGRRLQVVEHGERQATTHNLDADAAAEAVDALLAEPYGNWHVETADATVQLRVTKKGQAQLHRAVTAPRPSEGAPRAHDRAKPRLIDPDDPLFGVLGADADKRRQVDAFLRVLEPAVRRLDADPLRVVDLGCGNAYLAFAAHRYLAGRGPVRTVGVELRPELVERSTVRAAQAGLEGLSFVPGTIADADPGLDGADVALALHACDTATDEALARAVRWRAPVILAAPCCHRDLHRQLTSAPHPYAALTRQPILRERFADVLTDALRALLLRILGYRVDVVEFVDSAHTPRNAMIRAVRTGAPATETVLAEYRDLVEQWRVTPALARMLPDEVGAASRTPAAAPRR